MFRHLIGSALRVASTNASCLAVRCAASNRMQMFSSFLCKTNINQNGMTLVSLAAQKRISLPLQQIVQQQSARSVTKFSLIDGKRKTVKAVIKRFKRLHWGAWIRTYTGRHKKMFKKSAARKRRLRQHVFTNSTQSWLLDKMVTSFWRRPKYYIDDPYAPYHERNEFFATKSKKFKV